MKFKLLFLFLIVVNSNKLLRSQVAKSQVLSISVISEPNGFKLNWPTNTSRNGFYYVYSRELFKEGSQWVLNGNALKGPIDNHFITSDKNVEFLVQYANNANQLEAIGYSAASSNHRIPIAKGRTILLIDSAIAVQTSEEINQLQTDLLASGWFYDRLVVSKSEKPEAIKSKIESLIKKQVFEHNTLYIIGHVPVPYSGYFSSTGSRPPPDGHVEGSGNHTGAWPADVFYADFEGIWEDLLVKCTTGSQTRHHNIGGDGKFDPSEIPGRATLDVGRVDFFDMPAFSSSEVELTKEYLTRSHDWKIGKIPFVKRALIDNNFSSLNLASTGYHNFSCLIEADSIFDDRDYFKSQALGSYLWSYGCGAGSYTSCNGIGNTANFATYKSKDSFHNIFTILAGSYFGDWDSRNNLLRASLAAGSLATFWGGIPKWYVHHMGVGKHIGYGARITQNNVNEYFNGSFNASHKGVHIALLGDPTLEMIPVKPVTNVLAVSQADGTVKLNWTSSADAEAYEIFRIDTVNRNYIPVNSGGDCEALVTDTFFTDACNWSTGNYLYGVAAINKTTTPSGTYINRSLLSFASVSHTNQNEIISSTTWNIYPNPTKGQLYIQLPKETLGKWEVYDVLGRKLQSSKILPSDEGFKLNSLQESIYMVKFQNLSNGETYSKWIHLTL